jgi:hypothetical protein
MLYGTYRKLGLFYGSGVVEAGCRTVIGQRLKNSGMSWTKPGAFNVVILRSALLERQVIEALELAVTFLDRGAAGIVSGRLLRISEIMGPHQRPGFLMPVGVGFPQCDQFVRDASGARESPAGGRGSTGRHPGRHHPGTDPP